jgi:inner membrane protein
MSIIDPIYTLTLLLGVLLAVVRGRVRPAAVALGLSLLYVGAGFVQHHRAAGVQASLIERRSHEPQRARVSPTIGNMVLWRSIYEHDGRLYADAIHLMPLRPARAREGASVAAFTAAQLPSTARRTRDVFRRFRGFADGFTARVDRPEGSEHVVGDMRFSLDTNGFEPIWGLRLGGPGRESSVTWWELTEPPVGALDALWQQLTRPGPAFAIVGSHER